VFLNSVHNAGKKDVSLNGRKGGCFAPKNATTISREGNRLLIDVAKIIGIGKTGKLRFTEDCGKC